MGDVTRIYTGVIASGQSLAIEEASNVAQISINPRGGTATVLGNFPLTVAGVVRQSAALTVADGGSLTLSAKGPNAPLGGFTIAAVGGPVNIIAQF